jgi:hypothetical protein
MRGEDGLVESRLANVTLRSRGTDSPATVVGLSDCAEVQADRAVSTRTVGSTEHHTDLGPFHVKHHLGRSSGPTGRTSHQSPRHASCTQTRATHPAPEPPQRLEVDYALAGCDRLHGDRRQQVRKSQMFHVKHPACRVRGISAPEPAVPGSSRAERAPPVLRRAPRSGGTS